MRACPTACPPQRSSIATFALLGLYGLSSCVTPALWKNRYRQKPDAYVGAVGSEEVDSSHFTNTLWFKIPATPVAVVLDLCGIGVIGLFYLYLAGDDDDE